jgi:phosphonate transport system substrate-binding protein
VIAIGLTATFAVILSVVAFAFLGRGGAAAAPPLRYASTSRFPQATVEAGVSPLAAHIEATVGRPLELVEVASAQARIEQLLAGQIQLASLSPLSYVMARAKAPELPVIAAHSVDGGLQDRAYLVARTEAHIRSIDQIAGRSFCVPELISTTGSLLPRDHMRARGFDPSKLLSKVVVSGSQLGVFEDLSAGRCDAGGLSSSVWFAARELCVESERVRLVADAGVVPRDVVCASPVMAPAEVEGLRQAFRTFRSSAEQQAQLLAIDRFVEPRSEEYDRIEALARREGLLAP